MGNTIKSIVTCQCCKSSKSDESKEEESRLLANEDVKESVNIDNGMNVNPLPTYEGTLTSKGTSAEDNTILSYQVKGALAIPDTKSRGNMVPTPSSCHEICQPTKTKTELPKNRPKRKLVKVKRVKSLPSNTSMLSSDLPQSSRNQSDNEDFDGWGTGHDSGDLKYWDTQRSHHNIGPGLITPISSGDYIAVNAPLWKRLEDMNTPMDERPPVMN